jgi:hypothetical protein
VSLHAEITRLRERVEYLEEELRQHDDAVDPVTGNTGRGTPFKSFIANETGGIDKPPTSPVWALYGLAVGRSERAVTGATD